MAADGTKHPSSPDKTKEKEKEKEEGNEGGEGPSVEVKEESKDGAEVKPSKEKLNTMETAADNKPLGDKYSPKVTEENPVL